MSLYTWRNNIGFISIASNSMGLLFIDGYIISDLNYFWPIYLCFQSYTGMYAHYHSKTLTFYKDNGL